MNSSREPKGPITIRGITYPTVADAAEALMVTRANLYLMRSRGRLDRAGLGKGSTKASEPPMPKQPITLNGVTYPSILRASEMTGVEYKKLCALTAPMRRRKTDG